MNNEPLNFKEGQEKVIKSKEIRISYKSILHFFIAVLLVMFGAMFHTQVKDIIPYGRAIFGKSISQADKNRILRLEDKFGEQYKVVLDEMLEKSSTTIDLSAIGQENETPKEEQAEG